MVNKLSNCGVMMDRMVVLSPYRAQCHIIRKELAHDVPVISIVRSQGRSWYLIFSRKIYTIYANHKETFIGFLNLTKINNIPEQRHCFSVESCKFLLPWWEYCWGLNTDANVLKHWILAWVTYFNYGNAAMTQYCCVFLSFAHKVGSQRIATFRSKSWPSFHPLSCHCK